MKHRHPACHPLVMAREALKSIPMLESLGEHREYIDSLCTRLKLSGLLEAGFDARLWADPLFVVSQWIRFKQIYACREDLVQDLYSTMETPIPVDSLHLPFPCFYIDLEDTDCKKIFEGIGEDTVMERESSKILGFYVLMDTDKKTGETNCGAVILMETDGEYVFSGTVFGIPSRREDKELYLDDLILKAADGKLLKAAYAKLAFTIAAYLGSSKPDIVENPEHAKIYRPTRDPLRYASIRKRDVGTRYMKEKASSASKKDGSGSHVSPRPHMRRAHWHTYLTGQGRTERKLLWIPPVVVCADRKDPNEDLPAVVRTRD